MERETGRDLVLAARGHAPTTLLVFSQQGTAPDEVAGSPARIRATAGTVPGEAVVAAFHGCWRGVRPLGIRPALFVR